MGAHTRSSDASVARCESVNATTSRHHAAYEKPTCSVSVRDGLLAYVFGFTENQVMVMAKALPMGQIAAQKLLLALGDAVTAAVDSALLLDEADWSSASPWLAIAQMKHETQYSRLFRS